MQHFSGAAAPNKQTFCSCPASICEDEFPPDSMGQAAYYRSLLIHAATPSSAHHGTCGRPDRERRRWKKQAAAVPADESRSRAPGAGGAGSPRLAPAATRSGPIVPEDPDCLTTDCPTLRWLGPTPPRSLHEPSPLRPAIIIIHRQPRRRPSSTSGVCFRPLSLFVRLHGARQRQPVEPPPRAPRLYE